MKDPNVIFAGYRNPSPFVNQVIIRVQTTSDYTPQVTASGQYIRIARCGGNISTELESYIKWGQNLTRNSNLMCALCCVCVP